MTNSASPVSAAAVLDVCLCHASRRGARGISRIYDGALAPLGLKSGQFALLAAIAANAPATVNKLSEIMLMESSTLSRNLAPLRRAGYVSWSGAAGRRAGSLELTPTGEQLFSSAVAAWQGAQSDLSEKLGGSTAANLLQMLERAGKATQ